VGDEAGQVVVVDLVGERMLRCDEDVGEKAGFGGRDVCEPTVKGVGLCCRGQLCSTYRHMMGWW
jgi:hypothetical protein